MDPLAESRWRQAFPWLTETGRSRELRRLLRISESAHRSTAVQLRASGQFEQAWKADRRAEWAVALDVGDEEFLAVGAQRDGAGVPAGRDQAEDLARCLLA